MSQTPWSMSQLFLMNEFRMRVRVSLRAMGAGKRILLNPDEWSIICLQLMFIKSSGTVPFFLLDC